MNRGIREIGQPLRHGAAREKPEVARQHMAYNQAGYQGQPPGNLPGGRKGLRRSSHRPGS